MSVHPALAALNTVLLHVEDLPWNAEIRASFAALTKEVRALAEAPKPHLALPREALTGLARATFAEGAAWASMDRDEPTSDEIEEEAATRFPEIPVALVRWQNGCDRIIPFALRFLSEHPRPSGGQESYNSEHLLQLADEMEASIKAAAP